jgi:hypothetical protein
MIRRTCSSSFRDRSVSKENILGVRLILRLQFRITRKGNSRQASEARKEGKL